MSPQLVAFVAALSFLIAQQEKAPPSRELALELTSTARLAGTVGSVTGASIVARRLEQAGWKVELDEREVMLSLPRRIEVVLWGEAGAKEPMLERVERFDPDAIPPGDIPLFNAWTASGEVRAKVVDVGFGLRADYERLAAAKVDVRGCIALAKYGRAYRGIKAEMAQMHGCVGVLLYSDPAGDGGEKGQVWPDGPWKPDHEAQRGSIYPVQLAPGDPTTPGWASSKRGVDGKRVDPTDALPKILCTPIGAREARAIQARLAKNDAGEAMGPGPVQVKLAIDAPRDMRTIRNVIATLAGESDELVILGSHRDAWVRGAHDSGSGCVALMRVAQMLGERAKSGWKPRATLKLAFWDAEEFGLIGSTEWGEANADLLREKCLVYVNADACVSGTKVSASGSPGMMASLKRVFERLKNADGSLTLWDEWSASFDDKTPRFSLPGAGSDHAVFVHHLCLPMLEIGFGGNDSGGYHTAFDDFALVDRFLDPGWVGHELCATTLSELLVELATTPNAGFDSTEAGEYFAALLKSLGTEPWLSGASSSVAAIARHLKGVGRSEPGVTTENLAAARFYLALSCAGGVDTRRWFRNRMWAPALDNGYGSESFPTLRAAARHGQTALEYDVGQLEEAIRRLASPIDAAFLKSLQTYCDFDD